MAMPIVPGKFIVDGLIPKGLSLLCGRPKTGKSWLVMKLCLCVAQGQDFLGHPCKQGKVLYLALEDTHTRLKERMSKLTDEWPANLNFAVDAMALGSGLREQLDAQMKLEPDTVLIVIDTLQKIRPPLDSRVSGSSYGNDYRDMTELKRFADQWSVSVILVHHLRKMHDSTDPFNEISGTGGLMGAVDTAFLMQKESRGSSSVRLIATGRDVEDLCIEMSFENCEWVPRGETSVKKLTEPLRPEFIDVLVGNLREQGPFHGTASELLQRTGFSGLRPNVLTRLLSGEWYEWLLLDGIAYRTGRSKKERWIDLSFGPPPKDGGMERRPQKTLWDLEEPF